MNQVMTLTAEKFADIYTSEKFRNTVAYAHQYADKNGNALGRKTCSYPVEYIVTDEQIAEAKKELARAKAQTIADNKCKLLLVGMGITYEARYEDDVCNFRVRGEFSNEVGHKYFIEFGTGRNEGDMRIDHAIDRDLEDRTTGNDQPYNNFNGLERRDNLPKYTKEGILNIVNREFKCRFTEVVIDNYNVSPSDVLSVSPKKSLIPA